MIIDIPVNPESDNQGVGAGDPRRGDGAGRGPVPGVGRGGGVGAENRIRPTKIILAIFCHPEGIPWYLGQVSSSSLGAMGGGTKGKRDSTLALAQLEGNALPSRDPFRVTRYIALFLQNDNVPDSLYQGFPHWLFDRLAEFRNQT